MQEAHINEQHSATHDAAIVALLLSSSATIAYKLVEFLVKTLRDVYVTELLLNDWTDFDEIFCVFSRGSENGLDSEFCPLDNLLILECFTLDPTNFQIKDV
uniref:SFRICE_032948 n=1 Tax=Spodoptera frugiperda TaxID=7108 RepID=A0A2H1W757_SPOFR